MYRNFYNTLLVLRNYCIAELMEKYKLIIYGGVYYMQAKITIN